MKTISLQAEKREVTGRKVKRLRKEGKIPANIYGNKVKSESILLSADDFKKVYKEAGETNLVEITLGKDKSPVLIHEVQTHPVTEDILHVDFFKVNLNEKVSANVPVDIIGEPPAEKLGLGALVVHINEIEVECLPMDIPGSFEVDVTSLADVDQMIQVKDLKTDKKVEIKNDPEEIVVKIDPLSKVEEVAPVVSEESTAGEDGSTDTKTEESSSEGSKDEDK